MGDDIESSWVFPDVNERKGHEAWRLAQSLTNAPGREETPDSSCQPQMPGPDGDVLAALCDEFIGLRIENTEL